MAKGSILVKFVAPTINIPGDTEFQLEVEGNITIRQIIELYIDEMGEEYRRSFFEKDGDAYVHFLIEGRMLPIDSYVEPGSEIWVLPPLEGG